MVNANLGQLQSPEKKKANDSTNRNYMHLKLSVASAHIHKQKPMTLGSSRNCVTVVSAIR